MRIIQTRLTLDTEPREIKEITAEVQRWVAQQGIGTGLLSVYISHTSASLLIQENASPDVRHDLEAFLRRIVPENMALYRHNDEGPDDMPAHIKSMLTQTQLTIPVTDGRLTARHLAGDLSAGAPRIATSPFADPDPDRSGHRLTSPLLAGLGGIAAVCFSPCSPRHSAFPVASPGRPAAARCPRVGARERGCYLAAVRVS